MELRDQLKYDNFAKTSIDIQFGNFAINTHYSQDSALGEAGLGTEYVLTIGAKLNAAIYGDKAAGPLGAKGRA